MTQHNKYTYSNESRELRNYMSLGVETIISIN